MSSSSSGPVVTDHRDDRARDAERDEYDAHMAEMERVAHAHHALEHALTELGPAEVLRLVVESEVRRGVAAAVEVRGRTRMLAEEPF